MSTKTLAQTFLAGLRKLRTGQRSGAVAVYWRSAAAIAAGTHPKDKPGAIAESLDRLDRTEEDLAADAQLLAELQHVEARARQKTTLRARLKDAAVAAVKADERANALEREARDLRAKATEAKNAATGQWEEAARAAEQAGALVQQLAERGHPDHAAAIDQAQRDREIEALEVEARTVAEDLQSAHAAAIEPAEDAPDRVLFSDRVLARARSRVAMLEAQGARLQERIAATRNGEADAGGAVVIDDDDDNVPAGVEATS